MASHRRDVLAEFLRWCAAELRSRITRLALRLWEPVPRWLARILPPSRILLAIGYPLFLFGWAVAPAWKFIEWTGLFGPMTTTELPFSHLKDVAVDSQGRIYALDAFHGRVQRYSPNGEFQYGWTMPFHLSKVHGLLITPDDKVIVRANQRLVYSSDGELLESLQWQEEDLRAFEMKPSDPYAIRDAVLWPHVVDSRSGQTVVTVPWWKRLASFPFPAMLYLPIGLVFIAAGKWRQQFEPSAEPGA